MGYRLRLAYSICFVLVIFVFLLLFEHLHHQSTPNTRHCYKNTIWTFNAENTSLVEEQWEKDLEAELQDYEVVNDGNDRTNWEKDVDELLDDETDLK